MAKSEFELHFLVELRGCHWRVVYLVVEELGGLGLWFVEGFGCDDFFEGFGRLWFYFLAF